MRRLYLETTVWGMLVPGQPAEMRRVSAKLLDQLQPNEAYISTVVDDEIRLAQASVRRRISNQIARVSPVVLHENQACETLSQAYLDAGIVPLKKRNDALHVAVATIYEIEILVSWNYRHLANVRKNDLYRRVNEMQGYEQTPLILTPYEVIHG